MRVPSPFLALMIFLPGLIGCSVLNGDDRIYGSGSIEADEIRISPLVPGRITEILVQEGESFKKGDILVTLEKEEMEAHLRAASASVDAMRKTADQAKADFENAVAERNRIQKLYEAGAASRQALDQINTRYQVSKSRLQAARAQVRSASASLSAQNTRARETVLRAPVDGTVLSRNFEPGEVVLPGSAILNVADLDRVKLKIYVPEADLARIRYGQTGRVEIDGSDRSFGASVSFIASRAEFTPRNVQTKEERARLVFAVELQVPNPDHILKPGMPADGFILQEEPGDARGTHSSN